MERDQDLSWAGVCNQGPLFQRRNVIQGMALIAGGIVASTAQSTPADADTRKADKQSNTSPGSTVVARDACAVVYTSAGKVAGYIRKGIFTLKGMPYGDTTEGESEYRRIVISFEGNDSAHWMGQKS